MSRGWNIRCEQCSVDLLEDYWNHGDDELRALLAAADKIADLAAILPHVELSNINGYRSAPSEFFVTHRDHPLALYDEYGTKDGQCWHRAPCGGCGHAAPCALAYGHAPPCVPRAP